MAIINTALLSFGMSGSLFHAPFINLHEGFRLYAVLERTKQLAQQQYPAVKTYRSIDELLLDDSIDLVIVNTPNYTHYEYAKKALLASKHVVVEKPFTVSVAEGAELIALAQEQKKVLSVYHNRRYDSDYRTIKKIIEEGVLGEIKEAEFHFDRYKKDLSPKAHKEVPGPGRGALYDLGSHLIDQAIQLFGMPEAVFADIQIVRPTSKVDDYFELLLYYPGRRVRLRCSYLVREPLPGYVMHGINGSFIKQRTDILEAALQQGMSPAAEDWGIEPGQEQGYLHTEIDGVEIKKHIASARGNYMDFYEGLYQAIQNNAVVPVSAESALDVIRIIEASFLSNSEKRVINI
jgi:predicted dehydrogenase